MNKLFEDYKKYPIWIRSRNPEVMALLMVLFHHFGLDTEVKHIPLEI